MSPHSQERISFLFFPLFMGSLHILFGAISGFFIGGFIGSQFPDPALGWLVGLFLGLFTGIPLGWLFGIYLSWKIGTRLSSTLLPLTKTRVLSITEFLIHTWGLSSGMTLGTFFGIWLINFLGFISSPESSKLPFICWWCSMVTGGIIGRYTGKKVGKDIIFVFFRPTPTKLPLDQKVILWESAGMILMAFLGAVLGFFMGGEEDQIFNSFFGLPLGILFARLCYRNF